MAKKDTPMTESETREFFRLVGTRERQFEAAQNFLDAHEDENGNLSAKDKRTYDRMQAEIKVLTKQINDELAKPINAPVFDAFCYNGATGTYEYGDPHGNNISYRQSGVVGNEYHRNFIQAFRTNFKDARNYLREGELADGGYLVPTSFNEEIISKLQAENVLRQICRVIQTESTHRVPVVASQPAANWIGEGDEITISSASFSTVTLEVHKLAACLLTSNELLQDAYYDLEAFLSEELARAFARAEEEAFLTGDGTDNQPTGLLTTLAQSATSTLQTTGTTLSADDLITLAYSVDRPYRSNASWLMSDATLSLVRKLKTTDQQYIWEPNFASEDPPKILGYPVHTSNFMPPATSGNICVLFGDFSAVTIAERGNRQVRPLREKFALSDKTAFLCLERVDCALTDRHALRGLKIRQG